MKYTISAARWYLLVAFFVAMMLLAAVIIELTSTNGGPGAGDHDHGSHTHDDPPSLEEEPSAPDTEAPAPTANNGMPLHGTQEEYAAWFAEQIGFKPEGQETAGECVARVQVWFDQHPEYDFSYIPETSDIVCPGYVLP